MIISQVSYRTNGPLVVLYFSELRYAAGRGDGRGSRNRDRERLDRGSDRGPDRAELGRPGSKGDGDKVKEDEKK